MVWSPPPAVVHVVALVGPSHTERDRKARRKVPPLLISALKFWTLFQKREGGRKDTFAKRVLDESVDVVEIDVVIVIAKRLRPGVFPTRGVGHEHRESLRGREKRNHGGISAHESERNGEILQRDAISAISGRFDGVWVDEEE